MSRQFGAPEFGEGPASLSPVVLDARDLSLDSEMAADVDLLGARGSRILMQWTYILQWARPLSFRSQADFYETDGQKRMQLLSGPQNLTIC